MTINLWAFYRQSGTNVRSLAEIARQEIFKPIPYDDKKLVGLIPYDDKKLVGLIPYDRLRR